MSEKNIEGGAPVSAGAAPGPNFIQEIINEDNAKGVYGGKVATRFPPEPNGYLHIGHAKSICLNFGLAKQYGGTCNLRFDDTNPEKEDVEYVDSIQEDVRWLGFEWDGLYYASDYYEKLYEYAVALIEKNLAYVEELDADGIKEYRGDWNRPGRPSPYRDRPAAESLDLFRRMRAGEFPDGSLTLRAKIDLASGNMNMRDPILYRIRKVVHHRTGNTWCIYPMYDFAHPLSDALEGITHSICTLEFEDHRPLYDWCVRNCPVPAQPKQIEFARLNLTRTVMSKRLFLGLVKDGTVDGWDDPRMPTIAGIRRRGFTPSSIRAFAERIGVAKANSVIDSNLLFHAIREELNRTAPRAMAVLRPLKLTVVDYPEGQVEELEAENNPEDPGAGKRKVPFSRTLWIERDDFMEEPAKKWFRLAPGKEVRLKHAYYVTCQEVVKDAEGNVVELRCTHDPKSRGGWTDDGRMVKGTLHWVSAQHAAEAEVRLYDHLFLAENPAAELETKPVQEVLNPASKVVLKGCKVEPMLGNPPAETRFQFMRQGYFWPDPKESRAGAPVFNLIVGLKDTWAKEAKK